MSAGFYTEPIGAIEAHVFTASDDEAVDAWAAALIHLIDSTPVKTPFRVLMDVSAPQVSFTGYARQTTQRLFSQYRHRQGRIAFLFSSRTAPFYSRLFFASLGRLTFELNAFSDRQAALTWLNAG
jgi:hypothetical protein